MITTVWPTHILYRNIDDVSYCLELFNYFIGKYTNDWPDSFNKQDVFTHPTHKHSILDKAQAFIDSNIKEFFKTAFNYIPPHTTKTFATNHATIGVHTHQGSLISGIFYVNVSAGELVLHDPRLNAQRGYLDQMQKYFEPVRIQPQSGDLIIFPSFLQHEVPQNVIQKPRVIMPFDTYGDMDKLEN